MHAAYYYIGSRYNGTWLYVSWVDTYIYITMYLKHARRMNGLVL